MVKHSDLRGGASELAAAQARRLRRLRALITHYQVDAAVAAGVSPDAWSRMELGTARIDIVALARFCQSYAVPAEYVVTGRLTGLSDEFLRLVALAEASGEEPPRVRQSKALAQTAEPQDSAANTTPKPARRTRKPRRRRKQGTDCDPLLTPSLNDPE